MQMEGGRVTQPLAHALWHSSSYATCTIIYNTALSSSRQPRAANDPLLNKHTPSKFLRNTLNACVGTRALSDH